MRSDPDDDQTLMTVAELAQFLRVDRKTAYALANSGELPGVRRVGRVIRIHRGTVISWLVGQDRDSLDRSTR